MHSAFRFEDVSGGSFAHDEVLQTHQAIEQSFRPWRTTGNVNIDGNAAVNALHRRVGIKWPAGRGARAHRDRPFGLRHLIENAADYRTHLQSDCAGNDDEIALAWAGTKDAGAESIDIEARSACRHHLDRAAGQTKRHRPD